jgi:hypothetical protein
LKIEKDKICKELSQVMHILAKFGHGLRSLSLSDCVLAQKDLLMILMHTQNLVKLSMKSIKNRKEAEMNPTFTIRVLNNLRGLELIDCDESIAISVFNFLGANVLESLELSSNNIQDVNWLIGTQKNLKKLNLKLTGDEFWLKANILDDVTLDKLVAFVTGPNWCDNQRNCDKMNGIIKSQPHLKHLDMRGTALNARLINEISNLIELNSLQCETQYVDSAEIAQISKLINLEKLVFAEFLNVDFKVLSSIRFPNLRTLEIVFYEARDDDDVEEVLPQTIESIGINCPNLEYLRIEFDWTYELLYSVFKMFKNLRTFIASLSNLKHLIFNNNLKIGGSEEILFRDGIENPNLLHLEIDQCFKALNFGFMKMFVHNFPNVKTLKIKFSDK